MSTIYLRMEGGVIQHISPLPPNVRLVVIDYDVEGVEEGGLIRLPLEEGMDEEAAVTVYEGIRHRDFEPEDLERYKEELGKTKVDTNEVRYQQWECPICHELQDEAFETETVECKSCRHVFEVD
jgi:hypothetical protein